MKSILANVFRFYYDGFRSMTVGKRLWIIILVKVFILFFIFRLLLMPNYLNSRYSTDRDRGEHVHKVLTERKQSNTSTYE